MAEEHPSGAAIADRVQLLALARAVCEQAPTGLLVFDTDLRYVLVNPAMAAMANTPAEDLLGLSVRDAFPDYDALTTRIEQVLATGDPLVGFDVSGRAPGEVGVTHVWSLSAYRLATEDGAVLGVAVTSTEVTSQRALECEREALARRLELLAASGELLSAGLDEAATVDGVLQLVVPALAEWACLHLLDDDDGTIRLAAARHADPHRQVGLASVLGEFQVTTTQPFGPGRVIAAGEAEDLPRVTHEMLAVLAGDDTAMLEGLVALDVHRGIVVPLAARGVTFGALSLSLPSDPPDEEAAAGVVATAEALVARLGLVADLAARAALALDSARLYAQQREVAVTLQRSLLPQSLPRLTGWELGAQYLPGAAGTEVGGDFYEAVVRSDGRLVLAIGDVMGRGVRAAAVMGQVRAALRGYALEGHAPTGILRRLNVMVGAMEDSGIVTCLVGTVDLSSGEVELACAGHVPPLRADGRGSCEVFTLDPGPPLGVLGASFGSARVRLPRGGTLVMFTDGLVESRQLAVDDGIAALCSALRDLQHAAGDSRPDAERLCGAAISAMGRGAATVDDVAVLVLTRSSG